MRNKPALAKYRYSILSFLLLLGIWKLLTLHFSPLVVPTMSSVVLCLLEIFSTAELYKMMLITIMRLIIGLVIGLGIGLLVGIVTGSSQVLKGLLSPIIGLFQTIPPVSWMVLALVWFGFSGKPAIFMVIITTFPVIAINVCTGISNIDPKLLQMAQLYHFSDEKRVRHVVLPSIMPYFISALQVALGNGWKIAVMGELLTTSDGIGGMIKLARLNVEPENIFAWSIVILLLFYLSDFLLGKLLFRKGV